MTDQLQTLPSVAEEGVRLATAARTPGLSLRLLGGVAVWCHRQKVPTIMPLSPPLEVLRAAKRRAEAQA